MSEHKEECMDRNSAAVILKSKIVTDIKLNVNLPSANPKDLVVALVNLVVEIMADVVVMVVVDMVVVL